MSLIDKTKRRLRRARRNWRRRRARRKQVRKGSKLSKRLHNQATWWRKRKNRIENFLDNLRERRRKRRRKRRQQTQPRPGEPNWNGCRFVTDAVQRFVGGRAPTTSRKRSETYGNPNSEHHVSQTSSDAIDFGIANAYWLAREIYTFLTGRTDWGGDYSFFYFTFKGMRFRGQLIAGTHGTGPHLHFGCTRVG